MNPKGGGWSRDGGKWRWRPARWEMLRVREQGPRCWTIQSQAIENRPYSTPGKDGGSCGSTSTPTSPSGSSTLKSDRGSIAALNNVQWLLHFK